MAYTPTNNPYVPGDPYSYDLKWMVDEVKAAQAVGVQAAASAEAAAASAEAAAASAEQSGDWEADARLYAQNAEGSAQQAAASAEDAAGVVAPLTQALNTQGQQISVLESRMDTFASLTEGSTTGDAELQDIRVAADGTVYPTAGDAVRGQVSQLTAACFETISYKYAPGYLTITGYVSPATSSLEYVSEMIPVLPGFTFNIQLSRPETAPIWIAYCEYDSDFRLVGNRNVVTAAASNTLWSYTLTVSNINAKYLRISYQSHGSILAVIKRGVRNDLYALTNHFENIAGYVYNATAFKAGNGTINSVSADGIPSVDSSYRYRVYTKYPAISKNTVLTANDGFRFYLYTKNVGQASYSARGWHTQFSLAVGAEYLFVVARTTENTSEIADIEEFLGNITSADPLYSIYDEVNNLQEDINTASEKTVILTGRSNHNVNSIAHRGADLSAPENTMPAFKLAVKMGFPSIETDVAITSDGVAVLLHDTSINRTARNADGTTISTTVNIYDITYEQALTYDFGIWKGNEFAGTKIPTLQEFLIFCKNTGITPYIELKYSEGWTQSAILSAVKNAIYETGMIGKAVVISYIHGYLNEYVASYDSITRIGVLSGSPDTSTADYALTLKTNTNKVFVIAPSFTDSVIEYLIGKDIPAEIYDANTNSAIINASPYISGFIADEKIAANILYDHSMA